MTRVSYAKELHSRYWTSILGFPLSLDSWPALNACNALGSKSHNCQKITVKSYCKTLNLLLETYAIDDVIVMMDADMMHFIQPSNKLPSKHGEASWNNVLPCDRVFAELV